MTFVHVVREGNNAYNKETSPPERTLDFRLARPSRRQYAPRGIWNRLLGHGHLVVPRRLWTACHLLPRRRAESQLPRPRRNALLREEPERSGAPECALRT